MACRLFSVKPSLDSKLIYWNLDAKEQTFVKCESKYKLG